MRPVVVCLLAAVLWFAASGPALALAQGTPDLLFYTPYPAQEIAIGDTASIPLTLHTKSTPQTVRLELQNLPKGWTGSFRGDGHVVSSVFVQPEKDSTVDLRVEPPRDVNGGAYQLAVIGHAPGGDVQLPLQLTVKEKLPPALNLSVDLPTLRGAPGTTFSYSATLKNEGDEDLNVALQAKAPDSMQVDFELSGQNVTNVPVPANESKSISIQVKPFSNISAGDYPITVEASGGKAQASADLTATVVGQSDLAVSTPDGRLSAQAYAGRDTPLNLVVSNSGSAPARNIKISGSPPAGWNVAFSPQQIDEIPAGGQAEVTVSVKPGAQAIPGDYMMTVNATPQDGSAKSADFRVTVLTSTLWGLAGVALIAVAVLVVGLAVARFGRR